MIKIFEFLKRVLGLQATGCDRSQLCYIIKHYLFAFVPVFMLSVVYEKCMVTSERK